jgi:ubiquinone/menaquinone biosynthesis C-methylase UbiE
MPPQDIWEGFFNPAEVLRVMELDGHAEDVVEFGCGYGTFAIAAASMIHGIVHAVDIETDMVEATNREAQRRGLRNINAIRRDFLAEGTGLKDASVDYAMLFNILHIERPEHLLKEAGRVLRARGRLGIIHWNHDSSTPRGPSMAIRPTPEQCIAWASAAGFCRPRQYALKPYHYGLVMEKAATR